MPDRRQFLKSAVLFPALFSLCPDSFGQAAPEAASSATDKFVQSHMAKLQIPAVALAVFRDGTPLLTRAYGLANREANIAATPETPFEIASVSKQFFAAAILLLVQDGKMSLDDPASKYLQGTPDSWKAIRIRHLLSHTSGLVREAPGFRWKRRQPDIDVIRTAYGLPMVFEPGAKWQYSNLGYFMIAEIVRVVSGIPWAQFIHDRIFVPSGMTHTCTTIDPVPDRAVGYTDDNGSDRAIIDANFVALRPSGAFVSTVGDFTRWDAMLRKETLLTPESRSALWTPTRLNDGKTTPYGLGWNVHSVRGKRRAEHDGSDPGFNSYFIHDIDDGLGVVVLANFDKANPGAIAKEVARLHGA